MTSKEALKRINNFLIRCDENYDYREVETIKQDLERLEKIENLRTTTNALEHCLAKYMNKCIELEKENTTLKIKVKAWEKQGEKYKKAIDSLKEVLEEAR